MIKDTRWNELFSGVDDNLLKNWVKFNRTNPRVYGLFLQFAREAKASGRKYFSHWMIAQRIRWYSTIETTGSDYKLSNDFIALYARYLVYLRPEFEGFFKLKKMKKFRTATIMRFVEEEKIA